MNRWCSTMLLVSIAAGCGGGWGDKPPPYDTSFEIPRTEAFAESLSAYGLYETISPALTPSSDTTVVELSSELFTDYAKKQRLLWLPVGTTIAVDGDELAYPEGTILAKTFYYPNDLSVPDGPRRVIETRLLVKTDGVWNAATYLWNDAQNDATLLLDGITTDVTWTAKDGSAASTEYAVPHEGMCVTCHQRDGESAYVGPSLANLNRSVVRNGETLNQLDHLVAEGLIEDASAASAPAVPSYTDTSLSLEERARAYLHINCAHCHNPSGWDEVSGKEMDFRYDTPLDQTGLIRKADELPRVLEEGQMPYIGTTMLHEEGIELVVEFARTLQ